MLLRRLVQLLVPASLALGCAHAPDAHVSTAASTKSLEYLTVKPDVSVSRSALPYEERRAPIDPNADLMAEILAVPPGR